MITTKQQYIDYLQTYKNKFFRNAPTTPEEYARVSVEMLQEDIKQIENSGLTMTFQPNDDLQALLRLDKKGNIPERYRNKFEAYKVWASDAGKVLTINQTQENFAIKLVFTLTNALK